MEKKPQHIGTVYVRRKLGRVAPERLKLTYNDGVDNFNFDAILSSINKVADTVNKVGTAVNQVGQVVNQAGQVVQTVKTSTGQVQQIIGGQYPSQYYNQYPQQPPVQAGGFAFDGNVALMVGGSVLLLIVVVMLTR